MKCSFCGGKDDEVEKIIAASEKIGICDCCVMECLKILIYGEDDPIVIELEDEITEGDLDAQTGEGC